MSADGLHARSASSADECAECAVRPVQSAVYPWCSHACERSFRSRARWEDYNDAPSGSGDSPAPGGAE